MTRDQAVITIYNRNRERPPEDADLNFLEEMRMHQVRQIQVYSGQPL